MFAATAASDDVVAAVSDFVFTAVYFIDLSDGESITLLPRVASACDLFCISRSLAVCISVSARVFLLSFYVWRQ